MILLEYVGETPESLPSTVLKSPNKNSGWHLAVNDYRTVRFFGTAHQRQNTVVTASKQCGFSVWFKSA